jgi:hypothetical protein
MVQMTSQHLKQALTQAQLELGNAIQQRDHWNLEVIRLQSVVKSLAIGAVRTEKEEQIAEELNFQLGLAQTIEAILNQSGGYFSPVEMRDTLRTLGYDLARYANPLALIHQTLVRLAADKRIQYVNGKYSQSRFYELFGSRAPVAGKPNFSSPTPRIKTR